MAEQLALPGFEARACDVQMVYFALRPDPRAACEARQRAWELKRRHRLHGRPVPPERMHVSLLGVGESPVEPILRAAERAAAQVRLHAFGLHLEQVAGFGGRDGKHPVVLAGGEGASLVDDLRRELGAALRREGVPNAAGRAFSAHLTLFYAQRRIAAEWVAPVSWRVQSFVLIRSHFGESRHEVLGRWPLVA